MTKCENSSLHYDLFVDRQKGRIFDGVPLVKLSTCLILRLLDTMNKQKYHQHLFLPIFIFFSWTLICYHFSSWSNIERPAFHFSYFIPSNDTKPLDHHHHSSVQMNASSSNNSLRTPRQKKHILLWAILPGKMTSSILGGSPGRESFFRLGCEFTDCYVTEDRNSRSMDSFDAVIFNMNVLINGGELPWLSRYYNRSNNQRFIFFSQEPPM